MGRRPAPSRPKKRQRRAVFKKKHGDLLLLTAEAQRAQRKDILLQLLQAVLFLLPKKAVEAGA